MKKTLLASSITAVFILVALGPAAPARSAQKSPYPTTTGPLEPGLKELAESRISMVSAAHPFATQAGLEMLRRGGNAIDANVAATMVTAVLDVGLTQFGGGGQLTYYDAKTKKTVAINCDPVTFREDVMPFSVLDAGSGRTIPVPGSIAGFYYAVRKYGALSWKEVIEPAVFYAENGFPIYGGAYIINSDRYAALTLRPNARRLFAPNGFLPPMGSIFKQPELAETLKRIAEQGSNYFYRGAFARQMVSAIRDIGGRPTLDDFSSYRVDESEPVRGTYKGYQIAGPSLPGTGTIAIIEGMNILENVDLKGLGHYTQSADSLQWLIETVRVMFHDAYRYTGVPELDEPIGRALRSKEYARAQYELIRYKIEQMKRRAAGGGSFAPDSPSDRAATGDEGHTNHVSSVDKDGSVCSFTHTIYGPIYSAHGLWVGGIVFGSGEYDYPRLPGRRLLASIAPIIVFKADQPYFATGSSGGAPVTFYTLLNVLAWDKNLKEAQEAARMRSFYNAPPLLDLDNLKVSIENRIDEKVVEELKRRGYQFDWLGPYSQGGPTTRWLGGDQMAGIDPTSGMRYGATDPRGVGQAAGQVEK